MKGAIFRGAVVHRGNVRITALRSQFPNCSGPAERKHTGIIYVNDSRSEYYTSKTLLAFAHFNYWSLYVDLAMKGRLYK